MNTVNKQYKNKRLTKKGGYTKELDLKQELGYSYIYNRLAELEDEIENGTLIPKYSVVKDCGFYCVCEVNAQDVYVLAQCKTEAEAQKKLEELTK